jgi:RNA polymerase sigma-70 factor, ECF subfamily
VRAAFHSRNQVFAGGVLLSGENVANGVRAALSSPQVPNPPLVRAMRLDALAAALPVMEEALRREFEARLAESSTLAFRVAFSVLRQREDAEDVAQEAFIRAYRSFARLRDRARFRAWIVRATWRLALDRRRSDRRRELREQAVLEETVTRRSEDRAAVLWDAIDMLPEKLRMVAVLSGIEGHDVAEVASLLGIPQGTVKSRLFRARQFLKEVLGETR